MESIPVCGVEIKNDVVLPLDAPFLCMAIPVGITPQEQSGNGTPKREALKVDFNDCPPKYLLTNDCGTKACKIPAKKKPNNR